MNKRCTSCTEKEYKQCVCLLREGFEWNGKLIKPNYRIATVVILEATIGLRLGDVLRLRLSDFVRDGERWRLDFLEDKTEKLRTFTVPDKVYHFIQSYAYDQKISKTCKLFEISERQVQRHLNLVFQKMGVPIRQYGSHTFRKFFSMKVYTESGYDITLVQTLLQHSSPSTTRLYLNVNQKRIEDALLRTAENVI